MKRPTDWLTERFCGTPGSAKRLAYELRSDLCTFTLFGISLNDPVKRNQAVEQLTQAFEDYDFEFYDRVAEGLKDLAQTRTDADLRCCVARAYEFLKKQKLSFSKETLRELATRIYAVAIVTRTNPSLPLPSYPPGVEEKIARTIQGLPKQNWSRIYKDTGTSHLPQSQRGGKR
jgi:hypothetical protein